MCHRRQSFWMLLRDLLFPFSSAVGRVAVRMGLEKQHKAATGFVNRQAAALGLTH
jgi:hypothetical protein